MRALLLTLPLWATPVLADTIVATSRISAVTIYPDGAQVTREVVFSAPAGNHEVVILDLPQFDRESVRVTSTDAKVGTFAVRFDRLPPRDDAVSAEMDAAKAQVELAEEKLRAAQAVVAGIEAEVEAQEAQIKFLTTVKANGPEMTVADVAGLSQLIGAQVLTARKAALAAQDGLPEAEKAVAEAQEALDSANAAREAVSQRANDYLPLTVTVETSSAEGHLTVITHVYDANWAPVYDLTLDRKAGTLAMERGVLVSQASGEDWMGVDLTISTARPREQFEPSELYPDHRSVYDPEKDSGNYGGMSEPIMEPAGVVSEVAMPPTRAELHYFGDTVVYHYPTPVDLASGVENLRLALDDLSFKVETLAEAVPRRDDSAYLVARLVNDSGQILLPGDAWLHRDGTLIGTTYFSQLPPGEDADLGFGAIDGIRLNRDMPQRAEGDRGVFTSSTQIEEKAVLEVENLTDEAWKVRILDQVPYSEQEDLTIRYSADPEPTEVDVDGQRGIMAWDFDLAAGEKKEVALDTVMSWPEGMELQ